MAKPKNPEPPESDEIPEEVVRELTPAEIEAQEQLRAVVFNKQDKDMSPAEIAQRSERNKVLEQVVADKFSLHKHVDERLWEHALEEQKAAYLQLVANGVQNAEATIQAALAVVVDGDWPTLDDCIPEGSLLEVVDSVFLNNTDIPRALPFFAVLHYVSAYLLQRGILISFAEDTVRPDIWSVCLAESGSGKSFSQSNIAKALGSKVKNFPEPGSAAIFLENLKDHNRALWAKDEFAQFLKLLKEDKMLGVKDYLLRAYDGSTISVTTKQSSITIEEPALTIFGSTVYESLKDNLDKESLVDGFAQRFAFIVADREADRKLRGVYKVKRKLAGVAEKWNEIESCHLHARYHVSPVSEAAFEQSFQILISRSGSIGVPISFVRRVNFKAVKYALIYHVLLGKDTEYLDEEDFAYAARLCALNLRDVRKVLDLYDKPVDPVTGEPENKPLKKLLNRLYKLQTEGLPPETARILQTYVKVKMPELLALIDEAVEKDPSLAAYITK